MQPGGLRESSRWKLRPFPALELILKPAPAGDQNSSRWRAARACGTRIVICFEPAKLARRIFRPLTRALNYFPIRVAIQTNRVAVEESSQG